MRRKGGRDFEDGWFPDKMLPFSGNLLTATSSIPEAPARRRITGKSPVGVVRLDASNDPGSRARSCSLLDPSLSLLRLMFSREVNKGFSSGWFVGQE